MDTDYQKWVEQSYDSKLSVKNDAPEKLAGWFHNYFCDDDGAQLQFNPKNPNEYQCPYCHKIYHDEKKQHAYYALYRRKIMQQGEKAAFLYAANQKPRYLAEVKELFNFYSRYYQAFPFHYHDELVAFEPYQIAREQLLKNSIPKKPAMPDNLFVPGPGKLQGQGLDEAVLLIRLLSTYSLLELDFTSEEKKNWQEKLFFPMRDLLESQQFIVHNITIWREVAIQLVHLFFDQKAFTLSRPLGIYHNLKEGLTKEFWWYEGSFHYHFYTLEALSYLGYFLNKYQQVPEKLATILYGMLKFPVDCAFPDGTLPNPNDGWPQMTLANYRFIYEINQVTFKNEKFTTLYEKTFLTESDKQDYEKKFFLTGLTTPLEKNVIPFEKKQTVEVFKDSKVAYLQQGGNKVFVKFGVNSLNHAHFDPFQFEGYFKGIKFTHDLSNSGYGSPINAAFYQTTFAHQSLLLNRQLKNRILYDATVTKGKDFLEVTSDNLYETPFYGKRNFQLTDNGLKITSFSQGKKGDLVGVVTRIDLPFTIKDFPYEVIPLTKSELEHWPFVGGMRQAYGLENLEKKLAFSLAGLHFTLSLDNPGRFYLFETLDNPPEKSSLTIIAEGKTTCQLEFTVK